MSCSIDFDNEKYEIKTCGERGKTITYRAFEDIPYCAEPVSKIQKLNIFVPEVYYHGGTLNGYSLHSAPVFMPNTVGGYMAGPSDYPGFDYDGNLNVIFRALEHGYVVVSAGIRGRNSEKDGKAPAFAVDMKAAVRYLRYNKEKIPGNTEYIITNGGSAGGALSALTGASGNSPDYEPYLEAIGAPKERDDIFAASCYCPILNLENADAAYEWQFCGHNEYYRMLRKGQELIPQQGMMNEKQCSFSVLLKDMFPPYVNSLHLKDDKGNELTLRPDGTGSFLDYVKRMVIESAVRELKGHNSAENLSRLMVAGSEIEKQDYFVFNDGEIVDMDWNKFVSKITRMKTAPAFDAVDLSSPENNEFGTAQIQSRHFTQFSYAHSEADGELAPQKLIDMMNPIHYIDNPSAAPHWRIRHGAFDRDTSLAVPVILSLLLANHGYDVDFAVPWGLPHSGDYDLDELFAWVDRCVAGV